jgi:hypothetical protein
MPATNVPTNIANKVIMFPGVLCTPKQTAPMGGLKELTPRGAFSAFTHHATP